MYFKDLLSERHFLGSTVEDLEKGPFSLDQVTCPLLDQSVVTTVNLGHFLLAPCESCSLSWTNPLSTGVGIYVRLGSFHKDPINELEGRIFSSIKTNHRQSKYIQYTESY